MVIGYWLLVIGWLANVQWAELKVTNNNCEGTNISGMGLLTVGATLSWEETKKYADQIRRYGISQLINIYNNNKS